MSAETLTENSVANDFWDGVRLSMPVVVAAAPFGLLFGAIAVTGLIKLRGGLARTRISALA